MIFRISKQKLNTSNKHYVNINLAGNPVFIREEISCLANFCVLSSTMKLGPDQKSTVNCTNIWFLHRGGQWKGEKGGGLPTSWESWVAHEEILAGTCWVALGAVRWADAVDLFVEWGKCAPDLGVIHGLALDWLVSVLRELNNRILFSMHDPSLYFLFFILSSYNLLCSRDYTFVESWVLLTFF